MQRVLGISGITSSCVARLAKTGNVETVFVYFSEADRGSLRLLRAKVIETGPLKVTPEAGSGRITFTLERQDE
jgi:hypothetical protein